MKENNLRFIGPIKTATKDYCSEQLNKYTLPKRGDFRSVYSIDDDKKIDMFAIVWRDSTQMNFISNTSSCYRGHDCNRERTQQVDRTPNAPPEKVYQEIPQLEASAKYYKGNSVIDEHNKTRCDDIMLERKLHTKSWDVKVNHLFNSWHNLC